MVNHFNKAIAAGDEKHKQVESILSLGQIGLQVIVNVSRDLKPFIETVRQHGSRLVQILDKVMPYSTKIVEKFRSVLEITNYAFTENEQVDYERVKPLVEEVVDGSQNMLYQEIDLFRSNGSPDEPLRDRLDCLKQSFQSFRLFYLCFVYVIILLLKNAETNSGNFETIQALSSDLSRALSAFPYVPVLNLSGTQLSETFDYLKNQLTSAEQWMNASVFVSAFGMAVVPFELLLGLQQAIRSFDEHCLNAVYLGQIFYAEVIEKFFTCHRLKITLTENFMEFNEHLNYKKFSVFLPGKYRIQQGFTSIEEIRETLNLQTDRIKVIQSSGKYFLKGFMKNFERLLDNVVYYSRQVTSSEIKLDAKIALIKGEMFSFVEFLSQEIFSVCSSSLRQQFVSSISSLQPIFVNELLRSSGAKVDGLLIEDESTAESKTRLDLQQIYLVDTLSTSKLDKSLAPFDSLSSLIKMLALNGDYQLSKEEHQLINSSQFIVNFLFHSVDGLYDSLDASFADSLVVDSTQEMVDHSIMVSNEALFAIFRRICDFDAGEMESIVEQAFSSRQHFLHVEVKALQNAILSIVPLHRVIDDKLTYCLQEVKTSFDMVVKTITSLMTNRLVSMTRLYEAEVTRLDEKIREEQLAGETDNDYEYQTNRNERSNHDNETLSKMKNIIQMIAGYRPMDPRESRSYYLGQLLSYAQHPNAPLSSLVALNRAKSTYFFSEEKPCLLAIQFSDSLQSERSSTGNYHSVRAKMWRGCKDLDKISMGGETLWILPIELANNTRSFEIQMFGNFETVFGLLDDKIVVTIPFKSSLNNQQLPCSVGNNSFTLNLKITRYLDVMPLDYSDHYSKSTAASRGHGAKGIEMGTYRATSTAFYTVGQIRSAINELNLHLNRKVREKKFIKDSARKKKDLFQSTFKRIKEQITEISFGSNSPKALGEAHWKKCASSLSSYQPEKRDNELPCDSSTESIKKTYHTIVSQGVTVQELYSASNEFRETIKMFLQGPFLPTHLITSTSFEMLTPGLPDEIRPALNEINQQLKTVLHLLVRIRFEVLLQSRFYSLSALSLVAAEDKDYEFMKEEMTQIERQLNQFQQNQASYGTVQLPTAKLYRLLDDSKRRMEHQKEINELYQKSNQYVSILKRLSAILVSHSDKTSPSRISSLNSEVFREVDVTTFSASEILIEESAEGTFKFSKECVQFNLGILRYAARPEQRVIKLINRTNRPVYLKAVRAMQTEQSLESEEVFKIDAPSNVFKLVANRELSITLSLILRLLSGSHKFGLHIMAFPSAEVNDETKEDHLVRVLTQAQIEDCKFRISPASIQFGTIFKDAAVALSKSISIENTSSCIGLRLRLRVIAEEENGEGAGPYYAYLDNHQNGVVQAFFEPNLKRDFQIRLNPALKDVASPNASLAVLVEMVGSENSSVKVPILFKLLEPCFCFEESNSTDESQITRIENFSAMDIDGFRDPHQGKTLVDDVHQRTIVISPAYFFFKNCDTPPENIKISVKSVEQPLDSSMRRTSSNADNVNNANDFTVQTRAIGASSATSAPAHYRVNSSTDMNLTIPIPRKGVGLVECISLRKKVLIPVGGSYFPKRIDFPVTDLRGTSSLRMKLSNFNSTPLPFNFRSSDKAFSISPSEGIVQSGNSINFQLQFDGNLAYRYCDTRAKSHLFQGTLYAEFGSSKQSIAIICIEEASKIEFVREKIEPIRISSKDINNLDHIRFQIFVRNTGDSKRIVSTLPDSGIHFANGAKHFEVEPKQERRKSSSFYSFYPAYETYRVPIPIEMEASVNNILHNEERSFQLSIANSKQLIECAYKVQVKRPEMISYWEIASQQSTRQTSSKASAIDLGRVKINEEKLFKMLVENHGNDHLEYSFSSIEAYGAVNVGQVVLKGQDNQGQLCQLDVSSISSQQNFTISPLAVTGGRNNSVPSKEWRCEFQLEKPGPFAIAIKIRSKNEFSTNLSGVVQTGRFHQLLLTGTATEDPSSESYRSLHVDPLIFKNRTQPLTLYSFISSSYKPETSQAAFFSTIAALNGFVLPSALNQVLSELITNDEVVTDEVFISNILAQLLAEHSELDHVNFQGTFAELISSIEEKNDNGVSSLVNFALLKIIKIAFLTSLTDSELQQFGETVLGLGLHKDTKKLFSDSPLQQLWSKLFEVRIDSDSPSLLSAFLFSVFDSKSKLFSIMGKLTNIVEEFEKKLQIKGSVSAAPAVGDILFDTFSALQTFSLTKQLPSLENIFVEPTDQLLVQLAESQLWSHTSSGEKTSWYLLHLFSFQSITKGYLPHSGAVTLKPSVLDITVEVGERILDIAIDPLPLQILSALQRFRQSSNPIVFVKDCIVATGHEKFYDTVLCSLMETARCLFLKADFMSEFLTAAISYLKRPTMPELDPAIKLLEEIIKNVPDWSNNEFDWKTYITSNLAESSITLEEADLDSFASEMQAIRKELMTGFVWRSTFGSRLSRLMDLILLLTPLSENRKNICRQVVKELIADFAIIFKVYELPRSFDYRQIARILEGLTNSFCNSKLALLGDLLKQEPTILNALFTIEQLQNSLTSLERFAIAFPSSSWLMTVYRVINSLFLTSENVMDSTVELISLVRTAIYVPSNYTGQQQRDFDAWLPTASFFASPKAYFDEFVQKNLLPANSKLRVLSGHLQNTGSVSNQIAFYLASLYQERNCSKELQVAILCCLCAMSFKQSRDDESHRVRAEGNCLPAYWSILSLLSLMQMDALGMLDIDPLLKTSSNIQLGLGSRSRDNSFTNQPEFVQTASDANVSSILEEEDVFVDIVSDDDDFATVNLSEDPLTRSMQPATNFVELFSKSQAQRVAYCFAVADWFAPNGLPPQTEELNETEKLEELKQLVANMDVALFKIREHLQLERIETNLRMKSSNLKFYEDKLRSKEVLKAVQEIQRLVYLWKECLTLLAIFARSGWSDTSEKGAIAANFVFAGLRLICFQSFLYYRFKIVGKELCDQVIGKELSSLKVTIAQLHLNDVEVVEFKNALIDLGILSESGQNRSLHYNDWLDESEEEEEMKKQQQRNVLKITFKNPNENSKEKIEEKETEEDKTEDDLSHLRGLGLENGGRANTATIGNRQSSVYSGFESNRAGKASFLSSKPPLKLANLLLTKNKEEKEGETDPRRPGTSRQRLSKYHSSVGMSGHTNYHQGSMLPPQTMRNYASTAPEEISLDVQNNFHNDDDFESEEVIIGDIQIELDREGIRNKLNGMDLWDAYSSEHHGSGGANRVNELRTLVVPEDIDKAVEKQDSWTYRALVELPVVESAVEEILEKCRAVRYSLNSPPAIEWTVLFDNSGSMVRIANSCAEIFTIICEVLRKLEAPFALGTLGATPRLLKEMNEPFNHKVGERCLSCFTYNEKSNIVASAEAIFNRIYPETNPWVPGKPYRVVICITDGMDTLLTHEQWRDMNAAKVAFLRAVHVPRSGSGQEEHQKLSNHLRNKLLGLYFEIEQDALINPQQATATNNLFSVTSTMLMRILENCNKAFAKDQKSLENNQLQPARSDEYVSLATEDLFPSSRSDQDKDLLELSQHVGIDLMTALQSGIGKRPETMYSFQSDSVSSQLVLLESSENHEDQQKQQKRFDQLCENTNRLLVQLATLSSDCLLALQKWTEGKEKLSANIAEMVTALEDYVFPFNKYTRRKGDFKGSQLYLPGLIKAVITNFNYRKFFSSKTAGGKREYAVCLVVDISQSMDGHLLDCALEAVVTMIEALIEVKLDEFGLVLFGKQIHLIKDCQQTWSREHILSLLAPIRTNATLQTSTNDLEAIRLASYLLRAHSAKDKKMFVFTDGYSSSTFETFQTLHRIKEQEGIDIVGCGVGMSKTNVPELFCGCKWITAALPRALPNALKDLYSDQSVEIILEDGNQAKTVEKTWKKYEMLKSAPALAAATEDYVRDLLENAERRFEELQKNLNDSRTLNLVSGGRGKNGGAVCVDLVFLVDCTGSMRPMLPQVKGDIKDIVLGSSSCKSLIEMVQESFPGVALDLRVALVSFKDTVDPQADKFKVYPGQDSTFNSRTGERQARASNFHDVTISVDSAGNKKPHIAGQRERFAEAIESMTASGGGDLAEDFPSALRQVANWPDWQGSGRFVLLFTDAPPHGSDFQSAQFSRRQMADNLSSASAATSQTLREATKKLVETNTKLFFCSCNADNTKDAFKRMKRLCEEEIKKIEDAKQAFEKSSDSVQVMADSFLKEIQMFQTPPGMSSSEYAAGMHIVFVLDASGSMSGQKWSDLVSAYQTFLRKRRDDQGETDYISVVLFNHNAVIEVSVQPLYSAPDNFRDYIKYGTCFERAMIKAEECVSAGPASKTPVIVFMSDGGAGDSPKARTVSERIFADYGSRQVQIHTIAFGSDADSNALTQIATSSGRFHSCATGAELVSTFQTIATGAKPSQAIFEAIGANIANELTKTLTLEYF